MFPEWNKETIKYQKFWAILSRFWISQWRLKRKSQKVPHPKIIINKRTNLFWAKITTDYYLGLQCAKQGELVTVIISWYIELPIIHWLYILETEKLTGSMSIVCKQLLGGCYFDGHVLGNIVWEVQTRPQEGWNCPIYRTSWLVDGTGPQWTGHSGPMSIVCNQLLGDGCFDGQVPGNTFRLSTFIPSAASAQDSWVMHTSRMLVFKMFLFLIGSEFLFRFRKRWTDLQDFDL